MLSVEKKKSDLVVRLSGEIDHNAASRMRHELDALMEEEPRIQRLVFDMRGVEFMDISGIGMLIGRYKLMRRRGGSVAVTGVDRRVDKIFVMAGLYQIIEKLA